MGYSRILGLFVILNFTGITLTGCSSDSGSGSGSGVAPASYTGTTTQASVTAENSESLAEAALDGGAPGDSGLANATADQSPDREQLMGMARSLGSAMQGVDMSQASGGLSGLAAVTTNTDTVTSACGGTLAYNYTFDDVTGAYNGTFTFSNYVDCDDKSTINGSLTAEGVLNLSTYVLTSMNMTFTALTYEEGSESMTLSGTMAMNSISTLNYTMTMNMDFRDNVKNETYRLENYVVNITDSILYVDIDISGTVYHPTHGYVTVTTTTSVRINNTDENPTSGVVELVGTGGSKVRVTFTTNDTYTMDIDSDGDTTFETSKSCTWSTDTCI